MSGRRIGILIGLGIIVLGTGCRSLEEAPRFHFRGFDVEQFDPPTGAGAKLPELSRGPDGRILLSWVEPDPEGMGHLLWFASADGGAWTAARVVARGEDWFVNWADFPSVVALRGPEKGLAAHWLVRHGSPMHACDIHLAFSRDDGVTWGEPIVPHRDGTATEHGFVSLVPARGGTVLAVWLDGRNFAEPEGEGGAEAEDPADGDMTLRAAVIAPDGTIAEEALLDPRVCECCGTSAARTGSGAIVAYRDRTRKEIRDIAVVRLEDGEWSEPERVHRDGWRIDACPTNGPGLDAEGERVVVAWYTEDAGRPEVRVAFSDDEGREFGEPVRVDDGNPIGRAGVCLLPDGSALVVWLERRGSVAEIRVRHVTPRGSMEPAKAIARVDAGRASGFPRMVRSGGEILVAWTSDPPRFGVRAARIRLRGAPITK